MDLAPENWQLLADLGEAEREQWFYLPDAWTSREGVDLLNRSDNLLIHDQDSWSEVIKENGCLWQHRCRCGKVFPSRRSLLGHIGGLTRGLSTPARERMTDFHQEVLS